MARNESREESDDRNQDEEEQEQPGQNTTVVYGNHFGISGGVHHGDINFKF
ncbi:hypothetical protein [Streptomyces sp. NPDC002853]